jgi:hypothetical protein
MVGTGISTQPPDSLIERQSALIESKQMLPDGLSKFARHCISYLSVLIV